MYTKQDQGTLSRNFVRQMAKQFEQISSIDSTSYVSSHEANFKQCNWWLDMPSSATCFDDLTSDSQPQGENDCHTHFDIAGESVVHSQDVETAEIANEFQSSIPSSVPTIRDRDGSSATFFRQINECLSFPPKLAKCTEEKTK